jgi:hypothetical protein
MRASPSWSDLAWSDLVDARGETLEELYLAPGEIEVPRGVFRGRHLRWLDTRAARDPIWRPVEELFFARLPWFVDFDRKRWFWFSRSLGIGHFSPSIGPSRWRDAETIRMLYDDRRLPGFVNHWLYDEVKPVSEDLCLGIGGVNGPRDEGDQFFFALRRVTNRSA